MACAAKLDGIGEPLHKAVDVVAREHDARFAAHARLAGPDAAKAVWIGILNREVRQRHDAIARRCSIDT